MLKNCESCGHQVEFNVEADLLQCSHPKDICIPLTQILKVANVLSQTQIATLVTHIYCDADGITFRQIAMRKQMDTNYRCVSKRRNVTEQWIPNWVVLN